MITILNTSIVTAYGAFKHEKISLEQARSFVKQGKFQSAIGHESTAQIISELLGVDVPMNRMQYEQQEGEQALIFKLNGRPAEGQVLSAEQIHEIGFTWSLLERIKPPVEDNIFWCDRRQIWHSDNFVVQVHLPKRATNQQIADACFEQVDEASRTEVVFIIRGEEFIRED